MDFKNKTEKSLNSGLEGDPRPISVGFVTKSFLSPHDPEGADLQRLVLGLSQRGNRLVVLTQREPGQPVVETWNGIKVYRILGGRLLSFLSIPSGTLLRRLLMENSVDILHFHFLPHRVDRILMIAQSMRIRNILSLDGSLQPASSGEHHRRFSESVRSLKRLAHFDEIICTTENEAQTLAQVTAQTRVQWVRPLQEDFQTNLSTRPTQDTPSPSVDRLARIYAEEYSLKTHSTTPRADFAVTDYRLDRRTTCSLCQQGIFDETTEQAIVPGIRITSRPNSLFTVWRCGICRSIHSLPRVPLETYQAEEPLHKRRLHRHNAKHFSSFLQRLARHGVRPDSSILFYGVNALLFQEVAHRLGFSNFEIYDGALTPDVLKNRPQGTRDAVIVVDYLERSEEPRLVLELAAHELRPGGLLVAHTPDADKIPLNSKSSFRLRQPYNIHIVSGLVLESLARANGFRMFRQFRRHCMDTLQPFVNFRFLSALRFLGRGFEEDAHEFKLSNALRKWWRVPRLLVLGLLGGAFPEKTNIVALFVKQKGPAPAPGAAPPGTLLEPPFRTRCVVCGQGNVGESLDQAKVPSNVWRWVKHFSTVWRCRVCGALHSLERVDLAPFYEDYPYGERQLDGFARTVFYFYLKRLRRHGINAQSSILDYGCSQGLLITYLKERGFTHVAGYDSYVPGFADPKVLVKQYDGIICQDVIEHVEDPLELMKSFNRWLRPGGVLCVGTPRADGVDLNDIGPALHSLHQPYHLHILSERALIGLAERSGFKVEKMYRRHSCDTPVPFVNWPFYRSYMNALDGTLNSAFDPPWPEKVARSPFLLFWGLFGSFIPDRKDMMVMFRKI